MDEVVNTTVEEKNNNDVGRLKGGGCTGRGMQRRDGSKYRAIT